MKKTRGRILSLLLTAVMLFSLLPAAAGTAGAEGETATTTITVTPGAAVKDSSNSNKFTFPDLSLSCDGLGTIDSGYIEIAVGARCTVTLPSNVAVNSTTLTVGTFGSTMTYDFAASAAYVKNGKLTITFADKTLAQIEAVLKACTFTLDAGATADVTFKVGSTPIITYSGSGQHYRFIAYPQKVTARNLDSSVKRAVTAKGTLAEPQSQAELEWLATTFGEYKGTNYKSIYFISYVGFLSEATHVDYTGKGSATGSDNGDTTSYTTWHFASDAQTKIGQTFDGGRFTNDKGSSAVVVCNANGQYSTTWSVGWKHGDNQFKNAGVIVQVPDTDTSIYSGENKVTLSNATPVDPTSVTLSTGYPAVGTAITATVTTPSVYTYQWYRTSTSGATTGGTAIANATTATYTPTTADQGSYLYCVVTTTKTNSTKTVAAVTAHPVCSIGISYPADALNGLLPNTEYTVSDGTNSYPITADANGNIPFKGTYNSTDYDLAGKTLTIKVDNAVVKSGINIASRPAAPTIGIDYIKETSSAVIPTTVEYKTADGKWAAGTGTSISIVPGTTYTFRTAATSTAPAGGEETLNAPERPTAPAASAATIATGADATHTNLTLANTYEYCVSPSAPTGTSTWTTGSGTAAEVTAASGDNIYIRQKAVAATSFASAPVDAGGAQLNIAAIDLTGVAYSVKNDTLTGTTANMQYQIADGNWIDCAAGTTSGVNFAAGVVKVRQKDKPTNVRTVGTVAAAAAAPTASVSGVTASSITVQPMSGAEYSIDGTTWQTGNAFSGLNPSTKYTIHVRIAATDTALASKETSVTATTSAASSGTGGSAATPTTPAAPSTTVTVDGKTTDAGKVTTATGTDGTKTTTVAVDSAVLEKQVTAADKGGSVAVTVPETTGTASAQLVVKDVENLNAKDMSLEIKTGGVTYTVAPNAIDTAQVAAELGAADTAKVPLTVTVTPVKQSDVTVEKGTQVAQPVKFEVTASYNGKTVEVSHFDSYVSRTVELAEITDRNKITTGIRVEDGEQIPTEVIERNGKLYAKLNSLTNSTYTIIYNEAAFPDTAGKWYNDIVSEMASRTIVNGVSADAFNGDASVTRAEFAAILVRALGLPENGTDSFSDVAAGDWYYGAVGTASQYGLVNGIGDGSFRPRSGITREQAMAMLRRAAKVASYAGTTGSLADFTDADQVSAWAETAAAFNVGSGLIVGSDGALRPQESITRAEAATVVLRLLQKAGLVDIRSKT